MSEKSWVCAVNCYEKTRQRKVTKNSQPVSFMVIPEHRIMKTDNFVEMFGKQCDLGSNKSF